ncbi:MAG: CopG family transcriptional regulator [Planctomycetes bacterium]|nr:CopG family transcriptional regulator [Planctomycetota bacterium]
MKNVTITLDEEVARWARVWAARHETSVSRMLGEMLKQRMIAEEGYQGAMQEYLSRKPVPMKDRGSYPAREELHDRTGLR